LPFAEMREPRTCHLDISITPCVAPAAEPFPILLSQQKIAHLANLSRSSITPIVRGFVNRGQIGLDHGSVVVRTRGR
jgi:hypothetical protein